MQISLTERAKEEGGLGREANSDILIILKLVKILKKEKEKTPRGKAGKVLFDHVPMGGMGGGRLGDSGQEKTPTWNRN